MINTLYLPELREMLAESSEEDLREFCTALHPARTAEFMEGLAPDEAWQVLKYADPRLREEIFTFFPHEMQVEILETQDRSEVAELIVELAADDRVDLLDLVSPEIVDQICRMQAVLGPERRITNVVFMGMGEPLLNLPALREALGLLVDPRAFGLAPRRVTVSTVGVVPQLDRGFGAAALEHDPEVVVAGGCGQLVGDSLPGQDQNDRSGRVLHPRASTRTGLNRSVSQSRSKNFGSTPSSVGDRTEILTRSSPSVLTTSTSVGNHGPDPGARPY